MAENVAVARLLREAVEELLEEQAIVTWHPTWEEAQESLETSPADMVIVHLSGPNVFGLTAPLPDAPILVVTGLNEDVVGVRILKPPAQDRLLRLTLSAETVTRSLRFAIERRRIADGLGQHRGSVRLVPVPEHLKLFEGSVYAMEEDTD